MTSGKKLALVILAGVGLLGFISVVNHLWYVYPTPATESAFLKNYSPNTVIEQFQCKNEGAQETNLVSAGAGRRFVSNERVFEPRFVIKSRDWMPLMIALDHDVSFQLSQRGAEILSRTGDPRGGYRIQYQADKSVGDVAVEPLGLISVSSVSGPKAILPDDEQAVDLRITIHEKWFKSKPGMMKAKFSTLTN
jgi:hypothetical protein